MKVSPLPRNFVTVEPPTLKYIQTNLFFHFFQDGSDHGDVLVRRVGGRGFWLLPTEAEEHEDEDHRHVDQDDE